MGASVNKVIIIGYTARNPEVKYFQDGSAVCNFSVATNEEWKDKNTGEKREKTEWHRVVAFRRLGEICGQYLSKGRQTYVEGKLQTREWEDNNGIKRYTTEIVAQIVQFLGPKNDSQPAKPRPPQSGGYQTPTAQSGYQQGNDYTYPENTDSDGIPF